MRACVFVCMCVRARDMYERLAQPTHKHVCLHLPVRIYTESAIEFLQVDLQDSVCRFVWV